MATIFSGPGHQLMRQGKVVDVCCRLPPCLEVIERQATDRNAAMIAAHATGGYSYQQIADYFGVYFTAVGKIVRDGRGYDCRPDPQV